MAVELTGPQGNYCDATYEMFETGKIRQVGHFDLGFIRVPTSDLNPYGHDTEMTALNSKHGLHCDREIHYGAPICFDLLNPI